MRIGFTTTALFVVLLQPADAAELTLTDEIAKQAIEYGMKLAARPDEEFLREWVAKPKAVGLSAADNASMATVFTPFMQFAYFAHGENRPPTPEESAALAESVKESIGFRVLCFGKTGDFTKKAGVQLKVEWMEQGKQKSKSLMSMRLGGTPAEPVGAGAIFEDGSNAYGGAVFCSFLKSELRGDETVTLELVEHTRGVTLEYVFDLRTIR